MLMLGFEGHTAGILLGLTHNLHLDAFGSYIIEEQLGSRAPLGVYPPPDPDLDILARLCPLQ